VLGDPSAASALLRRAIPPDSFADVPAIQRPWGALLSAAAFAGDAEIARTTLSRVERELLPSAPMRSYYEPFADALRLVAAGRADEAIVQLRQAIPALASPDVMAAFLMGSMHDRAGRPDSARVWFERTLTTPGNLYNNGFYLPLARRRLAELAETRGDLRAAIQYYEAFLADWSDPEPALQPVVTEVRARVARLRARLAPG
jgi:tetratricopeptide (TPR) repeat protein